MQFTKPHPSIMFVAESLAIAVAYFALGRAGQVVAIDPGNVTPIWPASGFALAVVLWRGYRIWPGLWLGVVFVNSWPFIDLSTIGGAIRTVATGIAIGPGAICQAFLGAYLVRRYCTNHAPFGRFRDVFYFVGTQSVACLFGATFGVLALCLGGMSAWQSYGYTWLTWYLGDGVGIVLFAPAFLAAHTLGPVLGDPKRLSEALVILLLSTVAALLVFSDLFEASLCFLPLPLVLWAAVRGGQIAVSATVFVIAAAATWGTTQGRGPFTTGDTNLSLLVLQLYAATMAITGSAVAAALRERTHAEQLQRQTGSRLEQALRSGNVGLWDWDIPSNNVYFSAQLKRQLGYDPDEAWSTYEEWESRLHSEDKEAAVQSVRDYLQGDEPEYISTFRLRRNDGTYIWILSRGEAEWDDQARPQRIIGVHVDITEGKQRAEELERTNLELQQMAYAASHDLQEPLRSISSFSQLVERKYGDLLDDDGRSWLDAIIRGSKRMKTLIQDLRAYTQLDAPIHSFRATNMDKALGDALENLSGSIREFGAEVTHDRLPIIMGDPSQLVQLFQNLVGNAIKYRSNETPRVHISADRNDENWIVSVRDNGIGIDAAQHATIFEVFRRLHHRHEQPGTGIGLAICRKVVQHHHGDIWVESTPGHGSTFRFTVPIRQEEVTQ